MAKKTLTKEDVLHLAKLVNLKLSDEDIDQIQSQLSDTLDYVVNLDELDTSKIEGMSHSTSVKNVTFEDGTLSKRTFSQTEATENSKKKKEGYFVVDKIIDK